MGSVHQGPVNRKENELEVAWADLVRALRRGVEAEIATGAMVGAGAIAAAGELAVVGGGASEPADEGNWDSKEQKVSAHALIVSLIVDRGPLRRAPRSAPRGCSR